MHRYLDLIVTALTLLLAILLQAVYAVEVLQPFAGILLLACTGYAVFAGLTLALADHFDGVTLFAVTLAACVSTSIFAGIMLNLTPWGLTRESWLMSLSVITSLILLMTALGRSAAHRDASFRWDMTALQSAKLVIAGGLFAMAFAVAYVGALSQPTDGFTQFWMVKTGDSADVSLRIGIYNVENVSETYTLRITSDRAVVEEWPDIRLSPDAKWEVTWTPPAAGIVYPLVGELYIAGQDTVYRRTQFWPVEPPLAANDNG